MGYGRFFMVVFLTILNNTAKFASKMVLSFFDNGIPIAERKRGLRCYRPISLLFQISSKLMKHGQTIQLLRSWIQGAEYDPLLNLCAISDMDSRIGAKY